MFTSTRLKLTGWYLLIIILISICFSLGIYRLINDDYDRLEQMQRARIDRENRLRAYLDFIRQQQGLTNLPPAPETSLEPITQARIRLQAILVLVNLGILGLAGVAGYFLAGRTLRPIKNMVDEQNRFVTDASHELRTPLTSLKSEIEVNLRDPKLTLKEAKGLLESNLEEVNRLQYLSDNLIKLTKQQFNGTALVTLVTLSEVTEEAVKKVQNLAKKKKIAIKNQVKPVKLMAQKQSLTELLVILLDNAIKYSPEGTTVTLSAAKGIYSSALPQNDKVEIKVSDQGMGVAKQDLPHLFDRFYRADKSRSETEGYGLGLAIAKQIVEKHKGTIKVESELNKGTTFTINLPLK